VIDQRQDEEDEHQISVAVAKSKEHISMMDRVADDSSPSATGTDDDDDDDDDDSTEGSADDLQNAPAPDPYEDIPPATSSQLSQLDDGDIDMELVEQYDAAFNEFVGQNPTFLINNADLVHSLRVAKLQKILEKQDSMEGELHQQLEQVRACKEEMVAYYQNQLKEAARLKAAREIHLQTHLKELQKSTREMEVNLMWDLVASSESRAKEAFHLQQVNSMPIDREGLLELLPAHYFDTIRDAALAPPSNQPMTSSQEADLRQFQVDNAFLMAEVTVLQKKVAYQAIAAKKNAWVESVLCRLDRLTMKKLKLKYQRKTGVKI